MDAMTLKAVLTLDSSQYDSGLKSASSMASSVAGKLGGVFATGLKVAGAAVGAATAAVGAFAKSSIDAGMSFDKSMSQVAATMGKTTSELETSIGSVSTAYGDFEGNLREFAMFMGKNTKYSATEAADALNYMALAGYDAQTSMNMLPNVLNLAAAGAMDLARASDMVTDTQTAFGISLERTTQMVDEMAKAASTSNTSVEQLGDAFLVVGATAQELNGGIVKMKDGTEVATDGVQELEIALANMANAGIKGSEAGTHMRNMLMKLDGPTSDGAKQLERLGVDVFDKVSGNMRSLTDIFGDLSSELDNMTQGDRIKAMQDLFNTRDMASAKQLLNAVTGEYVKMGDEIMSVDEAYAQFGDDIYDTSKGFEYVQTSWDAIGESILGANEAGVLYKGQLYSLEEAQKKFGDAIYDTEQGFKVLGAAEFMAIQQQDNLSGDMDKLKSAFEYAQLTVSRQLTPALREFIQLGTDGLGRVADAFEQGGFEGAMTELGNVLGEGLNMITEKLPSFLQAGGDLLKALGDGLVQNMPMIMNAATQITSQFVQFITEGAPEFIECAVQILSAIGQGIMDNLDLLIETAVSIITQLGLAFLDAAPQLLEAGVQILLGLVEGISESLPVLIPAAVEAIVAIATALIENIDLLVEAAIQLALGLANGLIQATPVIIQAIPTLVEAIVTAIIENLPLLLEAAIQIHMALAQALVENAPLLLESIIQIFTMIGEMIITYGSQFVQQAGTIISNVVTAVTTWLSQLPTLAANYAGLMLGNFINTMISLPENIMELFNKVLTNLQNFGQKFIAEGPRIANEFKQKLIEIMMTIPDKMVEIGTNIVEGLKNGIAGAWESFKGWMSEMVSGFIEGVKEGLKIGSPSKVMADEIGKWIPAGIAVGIEDNMGVLNDAVDMMYGAVTPSLTTSTENDKTTVDIGTIIALLQNINDNTAEPIRLEGDMDRVFRVIQSKSTANYRLTGNNSLVTI